MQRDEMLTRTWLWKSSTELATLTASSIMGSPDSPEVTKHQQELNTLNSVVRILYTWHYKLPAHGSPHMLLCNILGKI